MIKLAGACMLLQIGGSFGDSSKHTGLMQIKSMAESGASARRATLAEFQKYAEQMAIKYSKEGVPMDQEVRNAIGIIFQYIDQMYDELYSYHRQDLSAAACPAALACEGTHLSTTELNSLNAKLVNTSTARIDHLNCRQNLKGSCQKYPYTPEQAKWWKFPAAESAGLLQVAEMASTVHTPSNTHCNSQYCQALLLDTSDFCGLYDTYRKTKSSVPNCMGSEDAGAGDDFTVDHIKANDDPTVDGDLLDDMHDCLEETRTWFDPLWEHYNKCKCRRCECLRLPDECHDYQEKFENDYCIAEGFRAAECNAFLTCWNTEFPKCQPGGSECQRIDSNVLGRKVDNETGERIRCLLTVLNGTDDIRVDELLKCNQIDYKPKRDAWNITCPDGLLCSGPAFPCLAAHSPCSTDFYNQEYRSGANPGDWAAHGGSPIDFRAPFDESAGSYEGQVGDCKTCSAPVIENRTCS